MTTTTTTFTVSGMTCSGCTRRVRTVLHELPGAHDVEVDLATGTVSITSETELDQSSVRTAVEAAGYEVAS